MASCTRHMFVRRNLNARRILKQSFRYEQVALVHTNSHNKKATTASLTSDPNDVRPVNPRLAIPDPSYERLDLSFENGQEAFRSKSNGALLRALLVFNLCSIRPLVDRNKELLKFSRKILGATLFEKMMKMTFYGQFVAGEDEDRIRPTVERNRQYGVKSILDYSVEKDLSREEAQKAEMAACVSDAQPEELGQNESLVQFRAHEDFGDRRDKVTSARTYFYEDEAQCDDNMENFLCGIDAVSGATNATGFTAIKLTALGRPQLLLQLSEVLARVRNFYNVLAEQEQSGSISHKKFEKYLKSFQIDREERKRWCTILDTNQDGQIDLLDWHNLLEVNISLAKLLRIPNIQSGELEPLATALTEEEEEQMKNMLARIDTIAKYGKEKDVRVMVDAEQTYFQVAINRLTMEMMRKYNKDKAVIFNTYQCYLKDTFNNITTDLALSKREDFFFGAKLVRGAYMEQERERADTLGYADPVNPNFEATNAMYEKVLDESLRQVLERPRGKIAVMIASHNEDTVRYTVSKMKEYDIRAEDKIVCFGQLLGMCDQVSFSLGQAGYSVYKYVPYGPVEEVLPYLSRRATENKGILAKVKKEKRLMRGELFRRLAKGQFFYKPTPPAPATSP